MNRTLILSCLLLLAGGCGSGGWGGSSSGVLTEPPSNWEALEKQTVTVEGAAGNSPSGPIVRFQGQSWIGLQNARTWGIDVVGRPIGVTGRVARGVGARDGEFVIIVDKWYMQHSSNVPKKAQ